MMRFWLFTIFLISFALFVVILNQPSRVEAADNVTGSFEAADCTAFSGWARNNTNPTQTVLVFFYIDLPSDGLGAQPTESFAVIFANESRSDLTPSGNYGFRLPTNRIGPVQKQAIFDGQPHIIWTYAMNSSTGKMVRLADAPRSITCQQQPPAAFQVTPISVCAQDQPVNIVQWEFSNNATGYTIYRDGVLKHTYAEIRLFWEDHDPALVVGQSYTYKVVATNPVGEASVEGSVRTTNCANPPTDQINLRGQAACLNGQPFNQITWNTPSPPATAGRRVLVIRGQVVLAFELPGTTVSYTDTSPPTGQTVEYFITMFDRDRPGIFWDSAHLPVTTLTCSSITPTPTNTSGLSDNLTIEFDARIQHQPPPGFGEVLPPYQQEGN